MSSREKYLGFSAPFSFSWRRASLCTVIPGFKPPTGSLSTTAALALCVFVAVPFYGIAGAGLGRLSKNLHGADDHHAAVQYHQRVVTHAGAGRAPVRQHDERRDDHRHPADDHAFFFPIVMTALGLLTGMVQAYIFSILAAVYIAAATRSQSGSPPPQPGANLNQNRGNSMDSMTLIAIVSIVTAGLTIGFGTHGAGAGRGPRGGHRADALAQQPDASATITRTLFVGLAMIESTGDLLFRGLDDPHFRQPVLEPRDRAAAPSRRKVRCSSTGSPSARRQSIS